MRKLPVLLVFATVAAMGFSMQGDYALAARQAQIHQTPSAEILRQHASAAAMMERALEQPTLSAEPVRWTFSESRRYLPRWS